MILTMDVAADLKRGLQLHKGVLGHEDLPRARAERLQLALGDLHELAWLLPLGLQALVDDVVDVELLLLLHDGQRQPGSRTSRELCEEGLKEGLCR